MRYSDPSLVDRLAAAYVLGSLAGGARRRFERLLQQRADVALTVAGWESRLGRLAQSIPPRAPPASVLSHANRKRPSSLDCEHSRSGMFQAAICRDH